MFSRPQPLPKFTPYRLASTCTSVFAGQYSFGRKCTIEYFCPLPCTSSSCSQPQEPSTSPRLVVTFSARWAFALSWIGSKKVRMIGAATPTVSPLAIGRWNEARTVSVGLTVLILPATVDPSSPLTWIFWTLPANTVTENGSPGPTSLVPNFGVAATRMPFANTRVLGAGEEVTGALAWAWFWPVPPAGTVTAGVAPGVV